MYVKSFIKNIIGICFICWLLLLGGCKSTTVTNGDIIGANSQQFGRIESTVETIDRIVNNSRERISVITESSRKITDGIERLEYLFNEYDSETNRIINDLIRERDSLKAYLENNVDINSNMPSDDSSKDSSNGN